MNECVGGCYYADLKAAFLTLWPKLCPSTFNLMSTFSVLTQNLNVIWRKKTDMHVIQNVPLRTVVRM